MGLCASCNDRYAVTYVSVQKAWRGETRWREETKRA